MMLGMLGVSEKTVRKWKWIIIGKLAAIEPLVSKAQICVDF